MQNFTVEDDTPETDKNVKVVHFYFNMWTLMF